MTCGVAVTTYQATGSALDLDIFSFDDVLPLVANAPIDFVNRSFALEISS